MQSPLPRHQVLYVQLLRVCVQVLEVANQLLAAQVLAGPQDFLLVLLDDLGPELLAVRELRYR